MIRPCSPSPCGPNSLCQEINAQAVCTCFPGYLGNPPTCRPECTTSTDCLLNEACVNMKCINPCLGTCGLLAHCQVINHNPVCSCPSHLTGDPFLQCRERRAYLDTYFLDVNTFIFRGTRTDSFSMPSITMWS